MKCLRAGCLAVVVFALAAGEARAQTAPAPGPVIDVPKDDAPALGLPRETQIENPLGRAPGIAGSGFGGYGELTFNKIEGTPAVVDLRRFVLYFGHHFNEHLRFYSEVEVEHAIASADDAGEVEIEQAYLDGLLGRHLNLRGGLIIMPVGIINVYHEPPTFNGVDRPLVDLVVIPTTWREPGFGIFGELAPELRYQLYLVNGFDANGFTAAEGIREGHQEAELAHARDFGAVARLDWEPRLGTIGGVSGYYARSGDSLSSTVGSVPIGIVEADARTHLGGFSARAEVAALFIGDAAALNTALMAAGNMGGPVSSRLWGGYAEAAYDVLRLALPGTEQALTPFLRYDYVNPQAAVPAGFTALPALRQQALTAGLVYRPIFEIALKLDYRRHFYGEGPGANEIASAITWMF